ncbi:hypothetical protein ANN_14947 [Periplaneta americana]|uniref:Endonuclease-reverse transcriptase n=1 Tax=Periplaneta americana TaxID=6978 RepID=A0ABQ8SZB5_PERAM|nr:hypothetical protein ANN_14947 [Periplaneta americana]
MGNACYYSVEKLLSSSLLSKNLKVKIYKTVILPVVLYGCETWTLTLREEHRFRVFENKVLRKIFGAKRDEVTGEWRNLHNAELHALYFSPDIIRNIKSRRLRWAGHVARMGESRNAYRVLVGRPEGKRPLGRPRRRWEDNIKMDLREVGYDDRDWINLAQDRDRWRAYVRAAMNLRLQVILTRCNSKTERGHCEEFPPTEYNDLCENLAEEDKIWSGLVHHLENFTPKCPVPPDLSTSKTSYTGRTPTSVAFVTPLQSPKVTVWCGIAIGPNFFENRQGRTVTVNSERYLQMLVQLQVILTRCNSKTERGHCEEFPPTEYNDLCENLAEEDKIWSGLVHHLENFTPKCPVPPHKAKFVPTTVQAFKYDAERDDS